MPAPKHRTQILELKAKGLSYREIRNTLGCSNGTISYHLNEAQRERTLEKRKLKNREPVPVSNFKDFRSLPLRVRGLISNKITNFHQVKVGNTKVAAERTFTPEQMIQKSGGICYLTGRSIDFSKPKGFSLDHVVSRAKGGSNTLDNCGVTCREANLAKHDMSHEEFLQLCYDVCKHNGLI